MIFFGFFSNWIYSFVAKISENALIGTIVVSIRATDPDSNPDLVYYLVKSSNLDNNNLTLTNEIFQAFDENKNPINVDLIKVNRF